MKKVKFKEARAALLNPEGIDVETIELYLQRKIAKINRHIEGLPESGLEELRRSVLADFLTRVVEDI